jgi:hypothetical protein
MENIRRGPTFGDFVTIHTEGSPQDKTVARTVQSIGVQSNVPHESLSEDNQNIPFATLKRRGSWVISMYHCMRVFCTCAELGVLSCVLGKAVPTGRMRADMHAANNNSSRKVKSRLGHSQVSFIFFGGGVEGQ